MILCTGCGTRNPDDARSCATCGRKLQSRWAMPGGQQNGEGQNGEGQNGGGQGGSGAGGALDRLTEPVWQLLQPETRTFDESAGRLMRSALETWTYVLLLLGCALAAAFTDDWRWLAGGVGLAALLAWARGI